MGATPLAALPYPELATDDPNIPADMQAALLAVEKKLVLTFADATARDSAITSPVAGMVAYLTTPKWLTMHDGSAWVVIGSLDRIGATLARSTNLAIANTTLVDVTWPTETADTDNFFTPTGATITIPAGAGGLYSVAAHGILSGTPSGRSIARVVLGGDTVDYVFTGNDIWQINVAARPLAAGDTVKVSLFQTSGGSLNLTTAKLFIYRVGP